MSIESFSTMIGTQSSKEDLKRTMSIESFPSMIKTRSWKEELNQVPHPSHRHDAAPFAPWPWVDLDDGL